MGYYRESYREWRVIEEGDCLGEFGIFRGRWRYVKSER